MLRFGPNQPEIYRANGCPHCELTRRLQDYARARQWLAQFTGDAAALTAIRRFLSDEAGSSDVTKLSDSEVIDRLAQLLGSGSFHVHATPAYLVFGSGGKASSSASSPAREIPFPLAERQPRPPSSSSSPPAQDPPTFGPDTDADAQAATLTAAAAEGKPFCPE